MPKFIKSSQAARLISVSTPTIERYVKAGKIIGTNLGERLIRIPIDQPFFEQLGITSADLLEAEVKGDDNE
jgi:excisionase family DNA binding protein